MLQIVIIHEIFYTLLLNHNSLAASIHGTIKQNRFFRDTHELNGSGTLAPAIILSGPNLNPTLNPDIKEALHTVLIQAVKVTTPPTEGTNESTSGAALIVGQNITNSNLIINSSISGAPLLIIDNVTNALTNESITDTPILISDNTIVALNGSLTGAAPLLILNNNTNIINVSIIGAPLTFRDNNTNNASKSFPGAPLLILDNKTYSTLNESLTGAPLLILDNITDSLNKSITGAPLLIFDNLTNNKTNGSLIVAPLIILDNNTKNASELIPSGRLSILDINTNNASNGPLISAPLFILDNNTNINKSITGAPLIIENVTNFLNNSVILAPILIPNNVTKALKINDTLNNEVIANLLKEEPKVIKVEQVDVISNENITNITEARLVLPTLNTANSLLNVSSLIDDETDVAKLLEGVNELLRAPLNIKDDIKIVNQTLDLVGSLGAANIIKDVVQENATSGVTTDRPFEVVIIDSSAHREAPLVINNISLTENLNDIKDLKITKLPVIITTINNGTIENSSEIPLVPLIITESNNSSIRDATSI